MAKVARKEKARPIRREPDTYGRDDAVTRAAPAGPSAADFAAMRVQLATLTHNYNELKAATGGVTLLAPEEVPIYEIGEGGYYSADDVMYPAGIQIEDVTGAIIPNEGMIPLNAPAERRMEAYLRSLPKGGHTPSHELIIEAAAMVLPSYDAAGRDPLEAKTALHSAILDQAMRLRMKQQGMLPGNDAPRLAVRPQRSGPAPMMSNTRIRQGDVFDRGHLAGPGSAPARGPIQTRVRAVPLAPAQKSAPPMGTVQNQTIGR